MQQGVGSFLPYIEAANVSLGGGYGAAGQGIGALGTLKSQVLVQQAHTTPVQQPLS
jgi:hypothetical protein